VNPDDPVGYLQRRPLLAAECVRRPTIADMGRWLRWPGNYTTGSADTGTFQNGTPVTRRHDVPLLRDGDRRVGQGRRQVRHARRHSDACGPLSDA
jgi:hypothetical protein